MAVTTLSLSPAALPLAARVCAPELLDTLAPETPEARTSRRELRRLNALMGNPRWFARALPRAAIDALDRALRPDDFPAHLRWHQCDVRAFHGWPRYPIILGNLVWHHFRDGELRRLGAALAPHTRHFLATEPHRSAWARWLFRVSSRIWSFSLVTRYDGAVSIAAGFRRDELPRLLGFDSPEWRCRVTLTVRGAYRLVAERCE